MQVKPKKTDAGYYTWYYHNVRKHIPRKTRRKDIEAVCAHCSIKLISRFGSVFGTKYCDDCRNDPKLKKKRERTYWHLYGKPARERRKALLTNAASKV